MLRKITAAALVITLVAVGAFIASLQDVWPSGGAYGLWEAAAAFVTGLPEMWRLPLAGLALALVALRWWIGAVKR